MTVDTDSSQTEALAGLVSGVHPIAGTLYTSLCGGRRRKPSKPVIHAQVLHS